MISRTIQQSLISFMLNGNNFYIVVPNYMQTLNNIASLNNRTILNFVLLFKFLINIYVSNK